MAVGWASAFVGSDVVEGECHVIFDATSSQIGWLNMAQNIIQVTTYDTTIGKLGR